MLLVDLEACPPEEGVFSVLGEGERSNEVVARRELQGAEDAFMLALDLKLSTHFNLPLERICVSAIIPLLPLFLHC